MVHDSLKCRCLSPSHICTRTINFYDRECNVSNQIRRQLCWWMLYLYVYYLLFGAHMV